MAENLDDAPPRHDAKPAMPSAKSDDGDVRQLCQRGLGLLSDLAAEAEGVAARPTGVSVLGGPVRRARARFQHQVAVLDALELVCSAAESFAALSRLCQIAGTGGTREPVSRAGSEGESAVVVSEASLRRRKTPSGCRYGVEKHRMEGERETVAAAMSNAAAEMRAVLSAFSSVDCVSPSTRQTDKNAAAQSLLSHLSELATAMEDLSPSCVVSSDNNITVVGTHPPRGPRKSQGRARISPFRWRVALVIETAKQVLSGGAPSPRGPRASSSLSALALQVQHVHHPFQALSVLSIPPMCRRAALASSRVPDALSAGTLQLCTGSKTAILSGGYRSTALLFAAALLLNHARRVLLPWLGAYVYAHPVESLRVARSRPDLLVEENLAVPFSTVAFMYCQRAVFDAAGAFLMARCRSARARATGNILLQLQALGFLVWTLATAEYLFCRLAHTFSLPVAYRNLVLFRPPRVRASLLRAVATSTSTPRLVLHAAELYCGVAGGLLPLVWAAAADVVLRRKCGLASLLVGAAGAMWFVIRFRSAAYLPLETAGLFIALGLAGVGGAVLAAEAVRDPLHLESRAAVAASRARELGGWPLGTFHGRTCRWCDDSAPSLTT